MFIKFQKLFILIGVLVLAPFVAGAETWVEPSCDPPACNTDGPVWSNPTVSQDAYADLDYSNEDDMPVFTITDNRSTGATNGSLYVNSLVDSKPALKISSTGSTASSYAATFSTTSAAAVYLTGGLSFAGRGIDPSYSDDGLLYYNTASHLFKFYNGTNWVELDNQWTTNGDEIYRSFATSAVSQGVGIKSGDATDPNDNYNLDIYRKSLGTGDKGAYARLEMVSTTDYVSGTLGGYEGALPVGVSGKAELTDGIGVYGIGDRAAGYFSGEVGINNNDPAYDLDIIGDALVDDGSGTYGVYIGNVTDAPAAQSLYLLENGSNGLIRNYLDNGSLTLQGGSTASLSNQIIIAGGSNTDDIKFNNGGSTVATIDNSGDIYLGQASASDDDIIYFDSAGTESLTWDDSASRFAFSDAVIATESAIGGTAIRGDASNSSASTNYGGFFEASGQTGAAVYGHADYSSTDSTTNYGGYFVADAGKGYGVYGEASSTADYNATGGYFTSTATRGRGVQGIVTDTSSTYTKYGIYGRADGATDAGVYGWATSGDASHYHYGLWGQADDTNGIAVYGYAGAGAYSGYFTDAPVVITNDGGSGGAVAVSSNTYATGAGELYVEYDIESDQNIYADRYYGNGSTTYYVDPNDTLTSSRLYSNLSIGYGSASDDDFIYFDQDADNMHWDNATDRFEFSDTVYSMDNIGGAGNFYVDYDYNNNNDYIYFGGTSGDASSAAGSIRYYNSGTGTERFYLSATTYAAGILLSSDARLKTNVKDVDSALQIVEQLRPVTFDWKKDGVSSYGFIAQEMYDVLPELVYKPDDGSDDYWGVEYSKLTSVLTAAMQEQQVQIEEQGKEIDELKKQVEYLMEKIK